MAEPLQQRRHGLAGRGEQRVVETRDEQRDAHTGLTPHASQSLAPGAHRRAPGGTVRGKRSHTPTGSGRPGKEDQTSGKVSRPDGVSPFARYRT
ncbi:hypothetical protein GCM10009727_90770 [Actinomadura napierensis]|uniref:Uncharacterized protein n=1 Tax=Actinomadura napierensis TaxID=267854 RepID=A0ABN3AH96_9ACTN